MAALLTGNVKPSPPKTVASLLRDTPNQPLTCHDRCDCSALEGDKNGRKFLGTCGAQAQVRITLASGPQMLFCGHHFGVHGPKVAMVTKVSVVYDQREQAAANQAASTTSAQRTPLVSAK